MSINGVQELQSIEVALDYAFYRVDQLEGKDQLAFANEYKEWLSDEELKEQVWFSISKG